MKFSLASLIALALASTTVMALSGVAPAAEKPTYYHSESLDERALEKRTTDGVVVIDDLAAYAGPQTSSPIRDHYHKGDDLDMVCYTRYHTTVIKGDAGWAVLTSGTWVPLANGTYVFWKGGLLHC